MRTRKNLFLLSHQAVQCHSAPVVYYQDDFISPVECDYVIRLAQAKLKRARVSLDEESQVIDGRSGSNCWISYDSDPTVRAVGLRIAAHVGLPIEHAEAMQVIHYGADQEYRAHFDAYDLTTARGKRCCKYGGQRLLTALVYLNDVARGGETAFPKLKLEVNPKAGRLIVFQNTDTDSTKPHPLSLHAGKPVMEGEKWAFNIWFHAEPMRNPIDFDNYVSPQVYLNSPALAADADRAPASPGLTVKTNRATKLFSAALDKLRNEGLAGDGRICFTYWDTFGGNALDTGDLPRETRVIALIPRHITNDYANKKQLPKLLEQAGLDEVAPKTFDNAVAAFQYGGSKDDIWFAKNAFGTGGRGMYCIAGNELEDLTLEKNYVLQKGVTDLALIDGKKFTTRIYCLIWNGEIYLYKEGFVVVHGVAYDPASTDYQVQIDHTGYHDDSSPVTMDLFSSHRDYDLYFKAFESLVGKLKAPFQAALEASDKNSYVFLGIDLLLQTDGGVKLIEVNTTPNFIHTDLINEQVNIPFFTDAIATMLGENRESLLRC